MRRDQLTDAQWKLIEPLLPKQCRGRRWSEYRTTLNGMLWVLRCGTPYSEGGRDMPAHYGSWKTVYSRFRRWHARQDLDPTQSPDGS